MARKSNKTAHVLNLLSGQNSNEEQESTATKEEPSSTAPASVPPAPTQPEPAPSNISIIDSVPETDPVAEKIRKELLKDIDPEIIEEENSEVEVPVQVEASTPQPTPVQAEAPMPTPAPVQAEIPVSQPTQPQAEVPVPTPAPVEIAPSPIVQEEATAEEESLELKEEPEVEAEPEPDYVILNIMEEIVKDKIIYFMKQFEVCTCDRCKSDTIALTLSGLPSKYRVVDKAAAAPLVSFYSNRLISQVTVEALKACTQVKDNPRH